jgi:hypothetical protein
MATDLAGVGATDADCACEVRWHHEAPLSVPPGAVRRVEVEQNRTVTTPPQTSRE